MARLLLSESKRSPFSGSVLQFGRHVIYFTRNQLDQWAERHGVELELQRGIMDDVGFFSAMGFDRVHSVDISSRSDSTFIHDLNQPVPQNLHGCYDVVFDGGTMEHIFDSVAVLRNVHCLLKVGGRVIHGAPCNNQVDQGYYMYSPSFFLDFYKANGYRIDTCYVIEHGVRSGDKDRWNIYPYPGLWSWKHISYEQYKGYLSIFFVAEKLVTTKDVIIPNQYWYKTVSLQGDRFEKIARKKARRVLKRGEQTQTTSIFEPLRSWFNVFRLGRRKLGKTKRLFQKPPRIARY